MSTRPTVYHVGRAGDIPGRHDAGGQRLPRVAVRARRGRGHRVPRRPRRSRHRGAALHPLAATHPRDRPSGERAVIVVHLSERGSFVREGTLARYAARLGLPVIAHLHGSEFAVYERGAPEVRANGARACARRSSRCREESSDISARHVGADRVELVPNAIPAGIGAAKTAHRRLRRRRLAPQGHRCAAGRVARRHATEFPEWTLLVAGPVRDEHLVDPALPRTRFLGSVGHGDLMELLERRRVAVLPSRDEAMPMFILEAMARRACVISTTVGGIPAVLDDDARRAGAARRRRRAGGRAAERSRRRRTPGEDRRARP